MTLDDMENSQEEPGIVPLHGIRGDEGALVPADPLQLYINKIRQYPALTREEEMELAKRFHETGDTEAAFRLVTANLMLVVKIAFEFRTQFQNMLDLIQEGNYGLMRALRKFDPTRGTRLSTYSAYWIKAYILKYLLDNWRLVKVGTTNARRRLLYNLRALEAKLREAGEPDAGPRLLADHFGATEQDVIDVQQSLGATDTSINQPMDEDGGRQMIETIADGKADYADTLGKRQIMSRFHDAIEKFKLGLKPSDLALLERRILSDTPITLQELGDEFGVSREAIRQGEERLIKRLKKFMETELADIRELDGEIVEE